MPRVEIYTKFWCGYCVRAKRLLRRKGIEYEETDVSFDSEGQRQMIDRAAGRSTVPQIFIDDRHVGGSDELAAADRDGRLDRWLAGGEPQEAS